LRGIQSLQRNLVGLGRIFMNFVVFFTDQQRWDTLGLNGNPSGLTPHLDRLARQGAFFREAVTPQPVCGPARSCLQTGQYATTTGVWCNGPGLKPDSPKLAELFNAAGYHTAYIGKWHLSENTGPGAVPAANRGGYTEWLGANCVELVSGPYSARLWDEADQPVQLPGYRSDAQTDAAIRFLSRRAETPDQPFLLFLSFLEPHHQNTDDSYPAPHGMENAFREAWLPPDLQALGGTSARDWAGYCAMVKRLDDALGRLNDALASTGLAEDTVVVFISDHGCHFKTRNAEYKRSPHESSVRVPMALWGPRWDGGGEHRCPVSLVDLAPTLLDTAGIPIPQSMQGRSLLPLTRGDRSGLPEESLIQFGDGFLPPGRALRTSRWKYAVTAPEGFTGKGGAPTYEETHLYDLRTDPYELSNLVHAAPYAELRAELRARLLARMAAAGEPPAGIQPTVADSGFTQRLVEYPNS
jgi:arylsulfatase A-like enzyme